MSRAHTDATQPTRAGIAHAVDVLRAGGLVAFPTETVYGLGADARNPAAVRRIFVAKGRPADHPLIVHIADAEALDAWCAEVPPVARVLAAACWPGPLTLILNKDPDVPDEVTGGQATVGLRVPAHPVARELLRAFGGGLAAPSANRFGHVSPTTAAHVREELADAVDVVLDGGACTVGIESTIVDVSTNEPRILRPGGIPRARIEAILGRRLPHGPVQPIDAPRVSGALASHYAPSTPVRWVETAVEASVSSSEQLHKAADGARAVGVLARSAPVPAPEPTDADAAVAVRIEWRVLPDDPDAYAHALYAQLRELDALGLDVILLEVPPDTGPWEAVRDRLRKAAGLGGAPSGRSPPSE